MKYKYINKDGQSSECEIERWAWGVVYKPTKEQIAESDKLSARTRDELRIERNQKLKEAREKGESKEELDRLITFYKNEIEQHRITFVNELKQFGDDGTFHRFAEIEQDRVDIFTMYRTDDPEMLKRIDIKASKGMQFIHFYRHIGLDYQSKENFRKIQVYVFGWRKNGVHAFNYILPDDRIVTSDHDIANLLEFNL